jgi:hypothetical protein
MYKPKQYLITTGGKLKCKCYKTRSSRKKWQWSKPAVSYKNIYDAHGGLLTAPKTIGGINSFKLYS